MNNAAYRDFFLGLTHQHLGEKKLSLAACYLTIAAGFDALIEVGSQEPHPSAFEPDLWPVIDLELVINGQPPLFRKHY